MNVRAILPFESVVEDVSGGNNKVQKGDYLSNGVYPVVDQGQEFIGGFSNDETDLVGGDGPWIVFGDHTRILKYVDFPFCMGADGVKVLKARPEHPVDTKYLFHFLSAHEVPSAGYSRHFKFLKRLSIRLPSLDEQRRIAAILDKADALRQKRKRALSIVDELNGSLFLNLFGDPAVNTRKFPLKTFGDISEKISDGPFGSNLKSDHYVEEGIRVVRLQNIGVGKFIDDDQAFISEEHFKSLSKHECLPGDVLVGTLGDPNLRACLQPSYIPVALNKADCVQIRPNKKVALPEYVVALINQPSVERLAHGLILGQTRARISMGRLRDLPVPIAPLDEQVAFVKMVQKVASLAGQQQESLLRIEVAFSSLQHRAFLGQL